MRSKRIQQLGSSLALTGMLSLVAIAPAFAADSSITTTGPDSTNKVENTSTNTITETNNNNLSVNTNNSQTASTGSAKVSGNTTGGSAMSGNASNSNNVSTTISVDNGSVAAGMGGGSGSGGGPGSGAGAGSGSPASASSAGRGSSAKTSATGSVAGVAMLPKAGCSATCDVNALRAAYKPFGGSTATALQSANKSSAFLMGLAALLSLVAAGGSAIYSTKQRAKA